MTIKSLCDSEYRFMLIVWEHAPVSSGKLVGLCADTLGWKKSTTYTTIKKLCTKGYIENCDATVRVLIEKKDVQINESGKFIERDFGGSLPLFISSFLNGKKISEKEAEEIKNLIDSYRED